MIGLTENVYHTVQLSFTRMCTIHCPINPRHILNQTFEVPNKITGNEKERHAQTKDCAQVCGFNLIALIVEPQEK